MRRVIGMILVLLGTILCIASIWLGVRSFHVHERHVYESTDNYTALIISKQGRFDLLYVSPWTADEPGWMHFSHPADGSIGGTDYGRRVFGFGGGRQLNGGVFVNVPCWFTAMLGASAPAWWALTERRRRRRGRHGRCHACGYDLRATPDHCPECGVPALSGGKRVTSS